VPFSYNFGPQFTNLFRIRIKIRLKFKILLLGTFLKPNYNYLTIDCWVFNIICIPSFFYGRKVNFIVVTVKNI